MKKAMAMGVLAGIILVLASFLVLVGILTGFFTQADPLVLEGTCRSSVMLRSLQKDVSEATFGTAPEFPLACSTQYFTLPFSAPPSKSEQVQKDVIQADIGDLMARCWRMFGNGMVENPFLQTTFSDDNCFVCYGFTIDDSSLKNKQGIAPDTFREFLFEKAYDVHVKDPCYRGGGTCVAEGDKCPGTLSPKKLSSPCAQGKDVCCSSNNECENKGGECLSLEGVTQLSDRTLYPEFSCGGERRCFMPKKSILTYADYIQFADGKGAIGIPTTGFDNEKQYGIMYVGSHKTCDAGCMLTWGGAAVVGAAATIGAVVVTVGSGGLALIAAAGVGATAGGLGGGYVVDQYLLDKPAPQAIFVGEMDEMIKRCPGGLSEGLD